MARHTAPCRRAARGINEEQKPAMTRCAEPAPAVDATGATGIRRNGGQGTFHCNWCNEGGPIAALEEHIASAYHQWHLPARLWETRRENEPFHRVVEAVEPLSERGVERPEAVVDMNRGRPNATLRDAAVTKVSMRAKRRWTTLVRTVNSTHTHTHC